MATRDEPVNDPLVSQKTELLKAELLATLSHELSGSEEGQPSNAMPAASTMHTKTSDDHDDFPEDALLEDEAAGWSAQFVVPFQQSGPMPVVNPQTARASTNQAGAPAQGPLTPRRFPIFKVALISTLIVLAVGFLALSVFAQPATHLTTAAKNPRQGPLVTHTAPTVRPTPAVQKTSTPAMTTATPQVTPPSDWVPSAQTLQRLGWTGAGLSTGDALEAERTAWTFTDQISMTMDIYSHVLPSMQQDAVSRLNNLLERREEGGAAGDG